MSRLVESLQLKDGILQNVEYHNMRMSRSLRDLFHIDRAADLSKEIEIPSEFFSGLFKCRVVYDTNIDTIEFIPYVVKTVRSLKIVHGNIDYSYKFEDRERLKELFAERENCDDILIVKNNRLTDTSSANIVLQRDGKWFTPEIPLLRGTKREKLLDDGIISVEEITVDEIKYYSKASLINAMLDIGDVVIDIENIL